jgi:uncharacterized protein (TIRG00374 family)
MRYKWLSQFVGLIIFVFILYKVNLRNVLALLRGAQFTVLSLAAALTLLFVVLKALRWKYLLSMQGIHYETRGCILAYLGSMYIGLVTPGRLGDFIKIGYLKMDTGVSVGRGFSSVFADRLFDLFVLTSMALSGALALALGKNVLIIILCWVFINIFTVFVLLHERFGKQVICRLFKLFVPKHKGDKLEGQFEEFYSGVEGLKKVGILIPTLLTVLIYSILYVQCYLIARALGISITLLNIAFCISAANLISLLPISISGIGTRDATMIALFSILQLSRESALSFSITFLFISNVSACIIGLIAWLLKPLKVRA